MICFRDDHRQLYQLQFLMERLRRKKPRRGSSLITTKTISGRVLKKLQMERLRRKKPRRGSTLLQQKL